MINVRGYQQQAYKKVSIETANPGNVLLQLYDAAIRFVDQATTQIQNKQPGPKGESLRKAHAIIAEFINALDHGKSPELCANLEQVYTFMLEQIANANNNMDATPLASVTNHLTSMRDTWQIAINQAAAQSAENTQTGIGSAL